MILRALSLLLLCAQAGPKPPPRAKVETLPAEKEEAVQKQLDVYFAAADEAERAVAFKAAQKAGLADDQDGLERIREAGERLTRGVPFKVEIPWVADKARAYFYLALPADYTPKRRWPLTFSLHGTENAPEAIMSYHNRPEQRYGMVTIFPITRSPRNFWSSPEEVANLFKLAAAVGGQVRLDPRRLFCYGGSGGGMGTWSLLSMYPEFFAAGASSAGYPGASGEGLKAMAKIPFYALHGKKDHIPIQAVRQAVEGLKKNGGTPVLLEHEEGHFPPQDLFRGMVKWLSDQPAQSRSPSPFLARERRGLQPLKLFD